MRKFLQELSGLHPYRDTRRDSISKISHFSNSQASIDAITSTFSLLLHRNPARFGLPKRSTSLHVFRDHVPLLPYPESYPLVFSFHCPSSLLLFSCYEWRTTPLRKPINPLNVVPRTSAKSTRRREGKCEESRREEPRPVKFPSEVIPRLRWPINMGKRRYARCCPEDFTRMVPVSSPPLSFSLSLSSTVIVFFDVPCSKLLDAWAKRSFPIASFAPTCWRASDIRVFGIIGLLSSIKYYAEWFSGGCESSRESQQSSKESETMSLKIIKLSHDKHIVTLAYSISDRYSGKKYDNTVFSPGFWRTFDMQYSTWIFLFVDWMSSVPLLWPLQSSPESSYVIACI